MGGTDDVSDFDDLEVVLLAGCRLQLHQEVVGGVVLVGHVGLGTGEADLPDAALLEAL